MESTKVQHGITNMFVNILDQRKALINKHEQENAEQERLFWRDPVVAVQIPRAFYNSKRREYFGVTAERHKYELDLLDSQILKTVWPDSAAQPHEEVVTKETDGMEDKAMHTLNPLKLNMLDKDMHELTPAELAYANKLHEQFTAANKTKNPATHTFLKK